MQIVANEIHVSEAIAEGHNQSLSLAESNESDGEIDGQFGDFFPFLNFPDEIIDLTFSFLSIKDRLSARVTRRLNKIELASKYYVEKLKISEAQSPVLSTRGDGQCIHFIEGKPYSSDCIRRLIQNVSIGSLSIGLYGSSEFHREVYSLIKDFNVRRLELRFWNNLMGMGLMTDSFFFDLTRACKELHMLKFMNITPEALHEVYKAMLAGSTKLRKLSAFNVKMEIFIPFLELIGIDYEEGLLFASRDVEAIEHVARQDNWGTIRQTSLFDGPLEMYLHHLSSENYAISKFTYFSFILHETQESLEKAKKRHGFVKVDLTDD